jgi:glucose/arabinose dehydrogenase
MVLPNGDVLVAETNAPARTEDGQGLKGVVIGLVMKRAGAALVAIDRQGALLVADDVGNVIWRVSAAP